MSVTVIAALAVLAPRGSGSDPVPPPVAEVREPLGEDPAAVFELVWERVRDYYYDPDYSGVDWPGLRAQYAGRAGRAESLEDLSEIVNDMLGRLGSSHTRFYTDLEPAYYHLLAIFAEPLSETVRRRFPDGRVSYSGIAAFTTEVDGRTYVAGVLAGGPADRAGLQPGERIVAVEGRPFHAIRSFRGRAGRPLTFTLQFAQPATAIRHVMVQPARLEPSTMFLSALRGSVRVIERGPRRVGYVRVWSYAGQDYHDAVREALLGELRHADALVLDLRGGWGGANPEYLGLFSARAPVLTSIRRDGSRSEYDPVWRKPVALVVDAGTRSGKEILAFGFKRYGLGAVVGTRTAGAVLGGRVFPVGRRCLLYLAVLDVRVDGERLEGRGVQPDVRAAFELPFSRGRDPQLEAAVDTLLQRLPAGP